jgi:serine/threonine-protein kinase
LTPTEDPDLPVIAGYELFGVLGRGGKGVVYKAWQRGLKRIVALKMILAGEHASDQDRARFRSEAEAVARLRHPNIVQVYDIGEQVGRPYFSLEYLEGGSLDKKIAGTPLPYEQAAHITQQLADAIRCAHEQGVIHRDLKPANVLLSADGTPKISDFGLAKQVAVDMAATQSGTVLGTPSYMAPEQAAGKTREIGPHSDIYGLGAILYELLTGRPPFKSTSLWETLNQVQTREPVAPSDLQPKVPRDLETICVKCLSKDPHKRYATAADLAEDLRRFRSGEPIRARPVSSSERLWRWSRRNPRIAVLAAAVAILLLTVAITSSILAWQIKKERDRADTIAAAEKAARQNADRTAAAARDQFTFMTDEYVKVVEKVLQGMNRPVAVATPAELALRDELLRTAEQAMSDVAKAMDKSGSSPFGMVLIHQRLGDLFLRIGQGDRALLQYQRGEELVARLAQAEAENDVARANNALMQAKLGEAVLQVRGDLAGAREHFRQAVRLQEDVAAHPHGNRYTHADNQRLRLRYYSLLGPASLRAGDTSEARQCFLRIKDIREEALAANPEKPSDQSFLAEAEYHMGECSGRLGDAKGVHQHFDRALALCEGLVKKVPNDFSFKVDLAEVQTACGEALLRVGETNQGHEFVHKAVTLLRELRTAQPKDAALRSALALALYQEGQAQARLGQPAKAEAAFREALVLREQSPSDRAGLMCALARCWRYDEAGQIARELRKEKPRLSDVLFQAARCLALCCEGAATTRDRQRFAAEALDALKAAVAAGFTDVFLLEADGDLQGLRQNPEFQDLVRRLREQHPVP